MKRLIFAVALAAYSSVVFSADIGVSVTIGEPGFYGRIDIGNFPQPQLIFPQPIVIQKLPVAVVHQPVYLHVPPGHAKNWHKHCHKYSACGQPVYFVREEWYSDVYVPHYRDRDHGDNHSKGKGKGKSHGKGKKDD